MNKVEILHNFLNDERRISKGGKPISLHECKKIILLLLKEEILSLNERLNYEMREWLHNERSNNE
jgi:hypothetical protein